jgi:hypothetical protein
VEAIMARIAAFVLLLLPGAALAGSKDVAPEQLLSADCAIYLRFDGLDTHRAAFDRTAFGEAMQGDLGDFVQYLGVVIKDGIGPAILKQQLLDGKPSAKLRAIRQGFARLPAALAELGRHGVAVGVEIIALKPIPRLQLTVVLPDSAKAAADADVLGALHLVPAFAEVKQRDYQLEGRTIHEVPTKAGPFFRVTWWQEGKHVVFVAGTEGPMHAIATLQGKHPSLLANPLYRSLFDFHGYETATRGFVDAERVVRLVRAISKDADNALAALGLARLKNVTGYVGFEGRAGRSTLFVSVQPAAAAGADQTGLDLSSLPPFPRDAGSAFALHLDVAKLYDEKVQMLSRIVPGGKAALAAALGNYNRVLGIDVRKDLLGALGPTVTVFNSPSDAPFNLGVGLAIQVKDVARLEAALGQLFKSLPAALGVDVSVKKEAYHGTVVSTVHVVAQGFLAVPTFAIQSTASGTRDNWLVVAPFPQVVHGFILRANGKAAAWQPDETTQSALTAARESAPHARILSVAVTDPRATVTRLSALAPFVAGTVNAFAPGTFDVQRLPNAQALTEKLFPNVSILSDDGTTTCLDSRFSLPAPVALLDPAALIAAALDLARIH